MKIQGTTSSLYECALGIQLLLPRQRVLGIMILQDHEVRFFPFPFYPSPAQVPADQKARLHASTQDQQTV